MRKLFVIALLLSIPSCCTVLGTGCGEKCTTIAQQRCNANTVQICNSNKEWDDVIKCDKVNGKCGVSAKDEKVLTCNIEVKK